MRLFVVVFVALAGCATYWTKPGEDWVDFNQATFQRESYECRRDASLRTLLVPLPFNFGMSEWHFRDCMRAHGYVRTD